MKNQIVGILIIINLTSCASFETSTQKTSWEEDCYRHYSETSYDLARCLDRLEKNKRSTPSPSTIGMEPENTDRPPKNVS